MKLSKLLMVALFLVILSGCSDEPKNVVESNIKNLMAAATGGKYDEQKFYDQISLEDKEIYFPRGKYSQAVVTPLSASYLIILSEVKEFNVSRSDIDKNKALVHARFISKHNADTYTKYIKYHLVKEDSGWKVIIRDITWN